jgi:acetyl-CoA acetyltransferase
MHEALSRNPELDPNRVDDVVLGCVTPIGDQGADIAKTAAIKAGLPDTVAGVQLNRFCASGLEAVNIAAQKVASGWEDLVFAGGVESMSRAPWVLLKPEKPLPRNHETLHSTTLGWRMVNPRPPMTPRSCPRGSALT